MKPTIIRAVVQCLAVIGVAAMAVGCATIPSTPEETVRVRASDRWQALIKSEFAKAYEYTTPAYKAIHPASSYFSARGTAAQWKSAEVLSVDCPEADKCFAKVRLDAVMVGMPKSVREVSTVLDETWLREDGQWWYFEKL
ncbi:MAG: hypothetical protein ABS39_11720 [Acidovorax sp. SCN 65-28]|jgi:hypothetical protein|uniref:hypothetical protein n=1 Tax=Acidovorax sp. TaxID=1872122 RepID=UPI0008684ADE|nr:hypothetical protein [Acidovorax sp.]MBN9625542.1 hypothetical protein [Acidovorax sp.]ODS76858.1 MAG: hypothetical protein ABS39_11720 [Acidovorax sp. SCN 65-28]